MHIFDVETPCGGSEVFQVASDEEVRPIARSSKLGQASKSLLLVDLEGVVCCVKPTLPKTVDGSNAQLRVDAISMLASLKPHFNIFLLADPGVVCAEYVGKTVQRLAEVGVLGALEVRRNQFLLFDDVSALLGFRVEHQVWVIRSLDCDLRSVKQVLQAAEADCELFWKAAGFIFPPKIHPHIVFSRNAVFDLDSVQLCESGREPESDRSEGRGLGLLASFIAQNVTKEHKPLQVRASILRLSHQQTEAVRRSLLGHRFLSWRAAKINLAAFSLFTSKAGQHDEQDLPAPDDKSSTG